ncbi:proteinase inhibitor kazal [Seiridium cupressi]
MQLVPAVLLAFAASSFARSTPFQPRQEGPMQKYQRCGGKVIDPQVCPDGYQCVEPDPRKPGVTDLPGICLPDKPVMCGGIIGEECFSTTGTAKCYDWPRDDCDPNQGGADCIGVCLFPLPA